MKKQRFYMAFYKTERGESIDRKTYNCSYGNAIRFARQYAEKIGAKWIWQFVPTRRFQVEDDY